MSQQLPSVTERWDEDRVILYHLGLGAGAPPNDLRELEYVLESSLKVLPTFGVVPALAALRPVLQGPGLEYDLASMLHAEHELIVHAPLPPASTVVTTPSVEAVYDKGTAALVVYRTDTRDVDGALLCSNRFTLHIRGEGGSGGSEPPPPPPWNVEGPPAVEVEQGILPQQAAIYRLSGDRNPLHIDPVAALAAGFDRPLLHGLCTYGMACKAVVDSVLDGDPARVARWTVRFTKPVFAGQTLVIRMWPQGRGVLVQVLAKETGAVVLSNGLLEVR